jgi:hypothetical protein
MLCAGTSSRHGTGERSDYLAANVRVVLKIIIRQRTARGRKHAEIPA